MTKLRVLPKQFFSLVAEDNRVDNLEVIRMYLITADDSIQLTPKQQELKERYDFADNLMRQNIYSYQQIDNIIMKKYGVAIDTARRYVSAAQYLYGSQYSRDKHYILMQHYDVVQHTLNQLLAEGRYKEAEGYSKLVLECIKAMPDRKTDENRAAAIIFNFAGVYNDLSETPMDKEKAMAITKKFFEDAEFEDVP